MAGFSLRLFEKRLAETIAWCKPRLNPNDLEHCFRTAPTPSYYPNPSYCLEIIAPFAVIVEQKRRKSFVASNSYATPVDMSKGRLMVSHLSVTTCDGIAPFDTYGYVDECDVPAWDTWVYWGRDYRDRQASKAYADFVIAWVPEILQAGVQNAIDASAVRSLCWLEEAEVYNYSFFSVLGQARDYFRLEGQ